MIESFNKGDKNKTTAEKLSQLSTELILKNGYQGFSYQDLATELGIKKASIHYYFPNKEDLGQAFIINFRKKVESIFNRFDEQQLSPKEKIFKYLKMFQYFVNSETMICPCGALSSEINNLPEKMSEELRLFFNQKLDWFEKTINEGIESGDFKKNLKAKDVSLLFLASIQGALQLARISKDKSLYDSVINYLKDILVEK